MVRRKTISVITVLLGSIFLGNVTLAQLAKVDPFKKAKYDVFFAKLSVNPIWNYETGYNCIAQSPDGTLYFGGATGGALTFNGTSWWTFDPKSLRATGIHSILFEAGKLYMAGDDYLTSIENSKIEAMYASKNISPFHNSLDDISRGAPKVGLISNLRVMDNGLCLESSEGIWWLENNELKFLSKPGHLIDTDSTLLVWQQGVGLVAFEAVDVTEKIVIKDPYGMEVIGSVRYDDQHLLFSANHGCFVYQAGTLVKLSGNVNDWLNGKTITVGAAIGDNRFALGTADGSICVAQLDGCIEAVINETDGLSRKRVNDIFLDNSNQLWAVMEEDIVVINFPDPIAHWDGDFGYEGMATAMGEWQDSLYICTSKGLYKRELQKGGAVDPYFHKNGELNEACWSLGIFPHSVLVASTGGLYVEQNGTMSPLLTDEFTAITRHPLDSNMAFAAGKTGLWSLRFKDGRWTDLKLLNSSNLRVRNMVWFSGRLWVATEQGGYTLSLFGIPKLSKLPTTDHGGRGHDGALNVHLFKAQPFFQNGGYWEIDTIQWRLYGSDYQQPGPEPWQGYTHFSNSGKFYRSHWPTINNQKITNRWGAVYDKNNKPLSHIGGDKWSDNLRKYGGFDLCYLASDSVFYYAVSTGKLRRYNGSFEGEKQSTFRASITSLLLSPRKVDWDIMGYTRTPAEIELYAKSPIPNRIPFKLNTVEFRFTAMGIDADEQLRFKYRLYKKNDTTIFSTLGANNFAVFPSLEYGKYTFEVAAVVSRNKLFVNATTAQHRFEIFPPWYWSSPARVAYAILAIAMFYIAVKLNSRRLERQKLRLKKIVDDRTAEIQEQKREIELLMLDTVHRAKGHIQLTKNLLEMQARRMQDGGSKAALSDAQHRLELLESVQTLILKAPDGEGLAVAPFLTEITQTLQKAYGFFRDDFILEMDIDDYKMQTEHATYLGLLASEILINAFKYAFIDQKEPRLDLSFRAVNEGWKMSIADNGPGIESSKEKTSYGRELIQLFALQLEAQLRIHSNGGTVYEVSRLQHS